MDAHTTATTIATSRIDELAVSVLANLTSRPLTLSVQGVRGASPDSPLMSPTSRKKRSTSDRGPQSL